MPTGSDSEQDWSEEISGEVQIPDENGDEEVDTEAGKQQKGSQHTIPPGRLAYTIDIDRYIPAEDYLRVAATRNFTNPPVRPFKMAPDDFSPYTKLIVAVVFIAIVTGFVFLIRSPLVSIDVRMAGLACFLAVTMGFCVIVITYMCCTQAAVCKYRGICCYHPKFVKLLEKMWQKIGKICSNSDSNCDTNRNTNIQTVPYDHSVYHNHTVYHNVYHKVYKINSDE